MGRLLASPAWWLGAATAVAVIIFFTDGGGWLSGPWSVMPFAFCVGLIAVRQKARRNQELAGERDGAGNGDAEDDDA